MPTTAINTWSADQILVPMYGDVGDAPLQVVNLQPNLTLARGTLMAELEGNNEVQTVTLTSPVGTWTLIVGGQPTTALASNVSASALEDALEALSTVGEGNVTVTGSAGGPYTVTFQGTLGFQNVAQMTGTQPSTSGTMAVTTATGGSAGTHGTFGPYDAEATNGLQFPRGLLQYACTTDGSGNVSPGSSTTGGVFGETSKGAPIYMEGYFKTSELVGLDENAITLLGGALVSGSIADGVLKF